MQNIEFCAALSCNDLIGPRRYQKIVKSYPDLSGFFQLNTSSQMEFLGIRDGSSARFFETMLADGEQAVQACKKQDIKIVGIGDDEYPEKLRAIPDPPFLFYLIGELNHTVPAVGVVGTREPSPDSVAINEFFTRELVSCNIGIVSGMAKGHDGIAQKIAVENDGYTAAVLGCGIDVVFPAEHKNLYELIKRHGAVVSEYPPGRRSMSQYFPLRNRIISGLSDVILLMQAPERSGALITAKYAAEQGKDVYVVPGNPTDTKYAGSNRLIRAGCKLALGPEDLILELAGKDPVRKVRKEITRGPEDLKPEEIELLGHLTAEIYIDDLAARSGMPFSALNLLLTRMEMRGIVKQYPGRLYIRNVTV